MLCTYDLHAPHVQRTAGCYAHGEDSSVQPSPAPSPALLPQGVSWGSLTITWLNVSRLQWPSDGLWHFSSLNHYNIINVKWFLQRYSGICKVKLWFSARCVLTPRGCWEIAGGVFGWDTGRGGLSWSCCQHPAGYLTDTVRSSDLVLNVNNSSNEENWANYYLNFTY